MEENKNLDVLKTTYYKLFKNKDPFEKMFRDHVKHKILLCPTNGYYLTKKQFSALIKSIEHGKEGFFFLSEVEGDCFSEEQTQNNYELKHWNINTKISYQEYEKNPLVLENAMYSLSGNWGVIISHEDHAVLGGSKEFVDSFKLFYPEWEQDLKKFVEMWDYNKRVYGSNTSWIPEFLDYIQD